MENYIRRVRVCGLFEQEQDMVVDFDQSINCIYGMNGTGKTVLINLIVNVFRANRGELIASPFSSITILTAADGKKQPEIFVTVTKYHNQISYTFNSDYLVDSNIHFKNRKVKIEKGVNYFIEANQNPKFNINIGESENKIKTIPRNMLLDIMSNHVSLTYVPLLRHSYRSTYNEQAQFNFSNSRLNIENESNDIYDPNTNIIAEIQDEFARRYASSLSVISRKLESLSSIIFVKLLLEEDSNKGPLKESAYINSLLSKGEIDDSVNVELVISQIRDLNLDIKDSMIREHYRQWIEIQTGLLKSHKKLIGMNDGNKTDIEKQQILSEYSESYYKLLSSRKLYNKLESAIEEIKSVYLKKQLVLSPFNMFKNEINNFLSDSKRFDFSDAGEFIFTNNSRPLHISKLSSGEKHLIAILGRVSFSASNMSTFIADEPELSLHLEWQREILPSIRRLSPNTQVIVATHSPAIISKNSNLIDIEECYKNA